MPAIRPIAEYSSSISGRRHRVRLFLPQLRACGFVPMVATLLGVAS